MNELGMLYDKGSSLSKRDKSRIALGHRSSHSPKKCRQIALNARFRSSAAWPCPSTDLFSVARLER
jgi:hypothetical protein